MTKREIPGTNVQLDNLDKEKIITTTNLVHIDTHNIVVGCHPRQNFLHKYPHTLLL